MTDQEHLQSIVQNANGSAELIRRMVGQVADDLAARGICPCTLRLAGKLLVEQLWEAGFAAEDEIEGVTHDTPPSPKSIAN